jgi:hypothetical protein
VIFFTNWLCIPQAQLLRYFDNGSVVTACNFISGDSEFSEVLKSLSRQEQKANNNGIPLSLSSKIELFDVLVCLSEIADWSGRCSVFVIYGCPV